MMLILPLPAIKHFTIHKLSHLSSFTLKSVFRRGKEKKQDNKEAAKEDVVIYQPDEDIRFLREKPTCIYVT